MKTLNIFPAVQADVAALAELWHEGWHQGHGDIVPKALVATRNMAEFTARVEAHLEHTFVARKGDALAGFYMMTQNELYQFYVSPAFQGKGVAADLMEAAEQSLSGRIAWLACSVGNDRAAAFYTKAGWALGGEEVYAVETADGTQDVTVWRFEKDLR